MDIIFIFMKTDLAILSSIFSETALPMKATFYGEPPWAGGTKFM